MSEPALIRATAPLRLDFAGAWTDVAPYAEREGGRVVSVAISLHAQATYELRTHGIVLNAEDIGETAELGDDLVLPADSRLTLLRAALHRFPVGPCRLSTRSDAPPGSGLGSSGALGVALVRALTEARNAQLTPEMTAEAAWHVEAVDAAIPGGRQDQYVAALGGCLLLAFAEGAVGWERITLDEAFIHELERRLVVCYTGTSRVSGNTISRVMAGYALGNETIGRALRGLRDGAEEMAGALRRGDLGAVGTLLDQNWLHQQQLDPGMTTSTMQRLELAVRSAGVLGGKAAGSGAGGCMFFLGEDPAAVRAAALGVGCTVLPVAFAKDGVALC